MGLPGVERSLRDVPKKKAGIALRGVLTIGFFTLGSRITGLAREATRAYFLGAGVAADAFQVAFQIPSVLRRLVGEGAVSSAVVPVAADFAARHGEAEQKCFAEKLLTLWTLLVFIATLLGVLFAGGLVTVCFRWGSFGDNPAKLELTAALTQWLFGYLLLVGVAAALQGLLNARNRFAAPAAAPLLFNLGIIAVAWIVAPRLAPEDRAWALAAGVLVGGGLQLAVMVPSVWALGVRPVPRWPFDHGAVRRIMRLLVPAVFGAGIYQINVLVSTLLAARLESDGAVSVLSYSNRLMEVVLGVFVFALGTVSLTALSERAANEDHDGVRRLLGEVLDWVTFITLPSTVALWILRRPVLGLLLRGGAFGDDALEMTAEAFRWHVLGLCFVGWSRILLNAFYAGKNVATPVRIATINLFLHVGLAAGLSWGEFSFRGIALASSLAAAAQTWMLSRSLAAREQGIDGRAFLRGLRRSGVASSVMALLIVPAGTLLDPAGPKLALAIGLSAVIALGTLAYGGVSLALGQPQANAVLRGLRRIARKLGRG